MSSILLHDRCPDEDDTDIQRLLRRAAEVTGAEWVELEIEPELGQTRRYRLGQPSGSSHTVRLDLAHFASSLRFGGVDRVDPGLPAMISFSLQQLLRSHRFAEQVSLLQGALEMTSNAVLLFNGSGDIVYANPPADRLLSRQAEDALEVESSGQRPQPMFMRVWSMVEKVLDGRVTQLPWSTTLVLSRREEHRRPRQSSC